eukprot:6112796-Pleurochrysis_carterae.AAC.1
MVASAQGCLLYACALRQRCAHAAPIMKPEGEQSVSFCLGVSVSVFSPSAAALSSLSMSVGLHLWLWLCVCERERVCASEREDERGTPLRRRMILETDPSTIVNRVGMKGSDGG